MRKFLIVMAVVVLPVWLLAQDVPKAEVFGGYSYLRTGGQGFNGFHAQVTGNRNEWFGLTGELSGQFAGQSVNVPGVGSTSAHVRTYVFLFGPTVSYREKDKFVPFAHLLAGVAHGSAKMQTTVLGQTTEISSSGTGFGLALGGGVDYLINESFSVRPVQIDYVSTNSGGGHANAFRYTLGIIFRISK